MSQLSRRGAVSLLAVAGLLATGSTRAAAPSILVVGIDTKFRFDDAGGRVFLPNAGDQVLAFDLADPAHPKLIGSLPLLNSVVGPPTNLAVTPDGTLALVANSLTTEPNGRGGDKPVPDDRLWVIDLTARPIRLAATLKVGAQPSGLGISADWTMALETNRVGKSVSVLAIHGRHVTVTDTVAMDGAVTSVAFTPDGRHALVCDYSSHKVVLLDIADGKVTRSKTEMPVGLWPYTVTVTTDGRFGLAGVTGNQATSDGNLDPVTVIDLAAQPPRTIDYLTAGDSVEGLAVSPAGDYAAATVLQGSLDAPKSAWYRHETGRVELFRVNGPTVAKVGGIDVGAFPEGVAFSPDGAWVYAGNFGSNSISVLHLEAGRLTDTHADITLPGPPAALRVGSQ